MLMVHEPNRSTASASSWSWTCAVETTVHDGVVTLEHGDGGRASRRLIRERIVARLGNETLATLEDAARLPRPNGPLAVTTDSFVVAPLFFPGGDIGSLAVHGTVNDLAVAGATPMWLTLALILEEGLPLAVLDQVLESAARAAAASNVTVIAGDTKVVPRGAADGLYLNTTGVGVLQPPTPVGAAFLAEGDILLLSGPAGRHGLAILAAREHLRFEPPPTSDSQPLIEPIRALCRALGPAVRAMRDATRGGAAAVLHEWAEASHRTLAVDADQFPTTPEHRGVAELLGIDPIYLAGEGVFLVAVEAGRAQEALAVLRAFPATRLASLIGTVEKRERFPVTIRRGFGRAQPLDEPTSALLPRIC